MSERTHWDGCWRERTHHECAVARCEELERERDARALADAIYPTGAAPLGDAIRRIGEMKDERDAALARAGVAEKDAARLDWIEQMLFERKWSGTIGEPSYWQMAGPYRHTLVRMRGENLRAAIDAARAEG